MRKFAMARRALVASACLAALTQAQAADYVLQAAKWSAAQTAAVAAAGGTVRFSHAEGLALVSSERADFLGAVLAGGAITSGAADRVVQFTPTVRMVDAGVAADALAPVTDTYYPHVQWAPQSVRAPQAWAAGYTGQGVRVAVIDGGVYGAHPDLAANVDTAAARSFVPGAAGSCETQWNCDTGTFWHGTHVSGIIAAPINGKGVVGIAPQATIVPVKALHNGSGSFGSVIQALMYASTEGGAHIINMSLGAAFNRGDRDAAELVSAMNRAVNFASRNGALVVSSAGNDSIDADHSGNVMITPGQSGNGLAVSATGPLGFALGANNFARISSYTNYGNSLVTVAGPGGDAAYEGNENCTVATATGGALVRPCWVFDMVFSTTRGGYGWAAGTSMAAPAVAAVAALIKQKHPKASVGELKGRVSRATDDLGKPGNDPLYGAGYINAAKAVAD